jgi:hypothetical protein
MEYFSAKTLGRRYFKVISQPKIPLRAKPLATNPEEICSFLAFHPEGLN